MVKLDELMLNFDAEGTGNLLGKGREKLKAAHLLFEQKFYADALNRLLAAQGFAARAILLLHGLEDISTGDELPGRISDYEDRVPEFKALGLTGLVDLNELVAELDLGAERDHLPALAKKTLLQTAEALAKLTVAYDKLKQLNAARLAKESEEEAAAGETAAEPKQRIGYTPSKTGLPKPELTRFPIADEAGKKPYYEVTLKCAMCDGDEFVSCAPRTKIQVICYRYRHPEFPLLVEEVESAIKGFAVINPLNYGIHVCPTCLYASANLGNFYSSSKYAAVKGLLHNLPARRLVKFRRAIVGKLESRGKIYEQHLGSHPPQAVFRQPRPLRAVLAAYELAALCAEEENQHNGNALFNAGKYLVSAARTAAELRDEANERFYLMKALDHFNNAFERCTNTAECLYLAAVIYAHFEKYHEARLNLSKLLTDKGSILGAVRYKGWSENLNHDIRKRTHA